MQIVIVLAAVVLFCSQASYCDDSNEQSRTLAFVSEESKRLLLLTWNNFFTTEPNHCELLTNWGQVNRLLKTIPPAYVLHVDEAKFQELENDCNELSGASGDVQRAEISTTEIPSEAEPVNQTAADDESSWKVIFPGTKWCGAGDKAKNDDDLGFYVDTDKCCRAHDKCDDIIAAGETKYNLTNDSPFTKLSCQCDMDFYDCLDKVDSMISNKIGNVYFNILRTECFTWDYPFTKKCKKYRSLFKITCKEYEKDTNAAKVFRWQKAKTYSKLPIPGPITIKIPFV